MFAQSVALRELFLAAAKSPKQTSPAQVAESSLCADSACQASRSRPNAVLSKATVARTLRRRKSPPPCPVGFLHPQRYQSSLGSNAPATGLPATVAIWSKVQHGNMCTSPLMMLPASPSPGSMPDDSAHRAIAFLQAALASFRSLGIETKSIMTDNGPAISPNSSRKLAARRACAISSFAPLDYRPRPRRQLHPNLFGRMDLRPLSTSAQKCARLFCLPPFITATAIDLAPLSTIPHLKTQPHHGQLLEPPP